MGNSLLQCMKYDAALLNSLSRDTATGYSGPLHKSHACIFWEILDGSRS